MTDDVVAECPECGQDVPAVADEWRERDVRFALDVVDRLRSENAALRAALEHSHEAFDRVVDPYGAMATSLIEQGWTRTVSTTTRTTAWKAEQT